MPVALRALDRGATLAVAGIWLSAIPGLDYAAELFQERRLRSVTANTRADGEEFLRLAGRLGIRATTVGLSHGGGRRPRWPTSRTAASGARPSCTTDAAQLSAVTGGPPSCGTGAAPAQRAWPGRRRPARPARHPRRAASPMSVGGR